MIEAYEPDGSFLIAHEKISGNPSIDIAHAEALKVSAPNINEYFRLVPYKYSFEDASSVDVMRFSHALRSILIEFRTDKKDTLAKTAEKIDFVTVGGSAIKQKV